MKELRLILGDQLNHHHSWFDDESENLVYAMFEMRQETDYVRHHIQKVVAFFKAMRNFRDELREKGHNVIYYTLDDDRNQQKLEGNIRQLIEENGIEKWSYQMPDEYRLDQQLKTLSKELDIDCEIVDTEHFYTARNDIEEFFKGDKNYLMERFYRHMRKKHDVLMDDDQPLGGEWNYDDKNRKKFPKDKDVPEAYHFGRDVSDMVALIREQGVETMGDINEQSFDWPVSRDDAEKVLDYFLEQHLVNFGTYQDAMTTRSHFLYHSRISFALNSKMLSPREVVDRSESYYLDHEDSIAISQIEGFIRQILGWREYMRGIYWAKMPTYAEENYFGHENSLPDFYWTADTQMKCLNECIGQSLKEAYAHHIQRLMVCGNFALLAGVDPDEVDAWYLGVYIDAIEWVEMPNTRGMSQFADGGLVASKPYVSSSNYINKMSNYCKECKYSHTKKTGENACPFNSLYWRFIAVNEEELSNNPRMAMMYRIWDKYDKEQQEELLEQADFYLDNINSL
jgi:deoxyribodipyrimidine photolyase-related protein